MIKILCFDKWNKCELFKKYFGKTRIARVIYSFNPDEALKIVKDLKPEIILLGGDVLSPELKSVTLLNMMMEWELTKGKYIYISTWDPDEARILKDIIKKGFYCPFSETLANIVKARTQTISIIKRAKERKNKPISPKKDK